MDDVLSENHYVLYDVRIWSAPDTEEKLHRTLSEQYCRVSGGLDIDTETQRLREQQAFFVTATEPAEKQRTARDRDVLESY